MYARNVADKELNFAVSGMLWNSSLVMIDEETESLWSHLLGKCMRGDLEESELETIPSVLTNWASWKQMHPDTSVMIWPQPPTAPKSYHYDVSFYESPKKRFVIGILSGRNAKCYPFAKLRKQQLINDVVHFKPIVIWFDEDSGAAWCYDSFVEDKSVEFYLKDGKTFDRQTDSQWDLRKGIAIGGQLAGQRLKQRAAIPSFERAWRIFYPKTETWAPTEANENDLKTDSKVDVDNG